MPTKENFPGSFGVKKYVVIDTLIHDGTRYEIGARVWLTDAQAAPILGRAVKASVTDGATLAAAAVAERIQQAHGARAGAGAGSDPAASPSTNQ